MKKIAAILLIFTLIIGQITLVLGADLYTNEADSLNKIGLFAGTGNGYDLDKPCDRIQGAVLFSRIIGKGTEASVYKGTSPFTDVPSWATPYVSYLYANGYTQGRSSTSYGAGIMSVNEYSTLILRALGYKDNIDFIWSAAERYLYEFGILTDSDIAAIGPSNNTFIRDFAVILSYRALFAKLKGSEKTLLQHLIDSGAILKDNVIKTNDTALLSLLALDNSNPDNETVPSSMEYATGTAFNGIVKLSPPPDDLNPPTGTVTTLSDLALRVAYLNSNCPGGEYKINLSNISKKNDFENFSNTLFNNNTIFGSVSGFIYYMSGDNIFSVTIAVTKTYQYELARAFADETYLNVTKNSDTKLIYPIVKDILQKAIKPNMTDYEKEKAIHDYMVLNFSYQIADPTPEEAFTTEGLLLNKTGVCQAYASNFAMFMNLMGIQCITQSGLGNGGDHLWAIIMLDGEWYNVDVTWDDPIPDVSGRVMYTFFNVTDEFLRKTHEWTPQAGVTATAIKYRFK